MNLIDLEIGQFATTKEWEIKNFYIRRKSILDFSCYRNGILERNLPPIQDDGSLWHSYFYKDDFELCDCNGNIIEKFTYPLYMESIIRESRTGRIVKFVSLTEGTIVIQGNSITLPSHRSTNWIDHMNTKHWKPCDFSKAPENDDLDYWDARYNAGLPVYFSSNYENNKTCYKANLLPSVLFKDNKNIKFHISCESKQKTEFTYPMYFECIANHCDKGMIVKFTELEKGYLTKEAAKGYHKISKSSDSWSRHTNESTWKQVNFDETICKIIPTQDDIDELISDLKSIIEDDDNRFSPSEYGAGTQLRESGYDQCDDLIDEWLKKYHITKAPDINGEKHFQYYDDLYDVIVYFKELLNVEKHKQNVDSLFGQNPFDEYVPNTEPSPCYLGIDYASQPDISFVSNKKDKSRLHNDALDAFSYAQWNYMQEITGATEKVVNNLNQTKEFTMNNELKEAILELIATNGKPKVKKPKTPKIVCNVNGDLMEFADEAELKQFMWSSRVESVIRYDLAGKVTVPFELSVEAPKTKASK